MLLFLYPVAVVALAAFSLFGWTAAVPLSSKLRSLSPDARDLLKRLTPASPRFVVYSDKWVSPLPLASQLNGFNVYALSFWMSSTGAADMAKGWAGLTPSQRSTYLQEYNAAGISLIVSAFGETDAPTSSGANPITVANDLASWVIEYGLQGVDVDYEDFNAFHGPSGAAESWLISLTQQLRTQLPQGEYTLSHAPVAPWFSANKWSGGGYLAVDQSVGYLIDWYNVQYYDQGTTEYTTCFGLLLASSEQFPESALFQISANGVPIDKLVIGKPASTSEVSTGYMDPRTLASCVSQAHSYGWDAGVMAWEFPEATSSWINTVRGSTF